MKLKKWVKLFVLSVCVLLLIVLIVLAFQPKTIMCDFTDVQVIDYDFLDVDKEQYINALCGELGIDKNLCIAILMQENPMLDSDAIHKNRNGTLDIGLWQMNDKYIWTDFVPDYWKIQEVEFNPFNWKMNTYLALHHIEYLTTKLKVKEDVVMAYNCGIGAVLKNRIPESTKNYLASVMNSYKLLNKDK